MQVMGGGSNEESKERVLAQGGGSPLEGSYNNQEKKQYSPTSRLMLQTGCEG